MPIHKKLLLYLLLNVGLCLWAYAADKNNEDPKKEQPKPPPQECNPEIDGRCGTVKL